MKTMSKKDKQKQSKSKKNKPSALTDWSQGIQEHNVGDLCQDYMKIFAANNNLMRHLAGLWDGIKPVYRRTLVTMYELGCNYDKDTVKVAEISGTTSARYHPHSDVPVYGAIVAMGQPWNNLQCLVEGQGNFGSVKGESPAAARYIEAKLSYYAYKCFFEEYDLNIVDTKPNYTGKLLEPEYLPARYPHVLFNFGFSLGYGVLASICPFNFKEVCELTIDLIDNPKLDDFVLFPDSPTGASIVDDGQFLELNRTGQGKYRMRGEIEIDEERNMLIVKSTPLQVNWVDVEPEVIKLLGINSKVLKSYADRCTKNQLRYELELKKEVDPYAIRELIYTKTNMEKTFPVRFILLEDYVDNDYSLKDIILAWIDFRRETKRRILNYKLTKYRERQHILKTLLFILNEDNAEKTATLIKNSNNRADIVNNLMKEYDISSLQANTIADMRFSALSRDSYKKYKEEKKDVDAKCEEIESIVRSAKKIDKIIKKELKEGIELFGEDRRSKIITVDNQDKIKNTNHLMVFTNRNKIKKLPTNVKTVGDFEQGDFPTEVVACNNTSDLLLFDETGKITKLPVHKVHGHVLSHTGDELSEYCKLGSKLVTIKPKPDMAELDKIKKPVYFLMISANGTIKKTSASAFANVKSEVIAMSIRDDDRLVAVKLLAGDSDILIYTDKGNGIRFNSSELRETGRASIGVRGITLADDEHVIGMDIINNKDQYIFIMTKKGIGKKSTLNNFKTMERSAKPLKIITLEDNDDVLLMKTVKDKDIMKVYLKGGMEVLPIDDVLTLPRLSKGKKLVKVPRGEVIIDCKLD